MRTLQLLVEYSFHISAHYWFALFDEASSLSRSHNMEEFKHYLQHQYFALLVHHQKMLRC